MFDPQVNLPGVTGSVIPIYYLARKLIAW